MEKSMRTMDLKALEAAMSGICAALYAASAYATGYIVSPIFGVVQFRPAVIIPAVFAILFGPLIGGLGAAIGTFISDMAVHGEPLLSLIAGVPANFVCFYLIGYLSKKIVGNQSMATLIAGVNGSITGFFIDYAANTYVNIVWISLTVDLTIASLIGFICFLLPSYIILRKYKWGSQFIASTIGLGVGSVMVGLGVWFYSQFFVSAIVPQYLPGIAILTWTIWVFTTEIPFLIFVTPPILKACYRAFPRPS